MLALVAALGSLLLAASPALAQGVSFSSPTNFSAGDGPIWVAVGDFNADSDPDLAVANNVSDNVSVLLNEANDAPVAAGDSYTTDEDEPLNVGAATGVLSNDTGSDGDTLTVVDGDGNAANGISPVSGPTNGKLTLNEDGSFTYTPNANFNGPDSFTYKATDGTENSNTATVSITVNPVNDEPTITVAGGGSCSSTTVSGTMNLTLGDAETAAGSLNLSASSSNTSLVPNANISFGGSGANRTVTITPVAKKSGNATITLTVSDGQGGTATTTIEVTVGTDKKETINGTSGSDMIFGLNGDDTINAGNANDLVCGGNGGGTISGGTGDDTLDGGKGNDTLKGEEGNDILRGGQGNDRLEGGNNDDTLTGGNGADSFDGGAGTDSATDFNAGEGDSRTNIP